MTFSRPGVAAIRILSGDRLRIERPERDCLEPGRTSFDADVTCNTQIDLLSTSAPDSRRNTSRMPSEARTVSDASAVGIELPSGAIHAGVDGTGHRYAGNSPGSATPTRAANSWTG